MVAIFPSMAIFHISAGRIVTFNHSTCIVRKRLTSLTHEKHDKPCIGTDRALPCSANANFHCGSGGLDSGGLCWFTTDVAAIKMVDLAGTSTIAWHNFGVL